MTVIVQEYTGHQSQSRRHEYNATCYGKRYVAQRTPGSAERVEKVYIHRGIYEAGGIGAREARQAGDGRRRQARMRRAGHGIWWQVYRQGRYTGYEGMRQERKVAVVRGRR